MELRLEQEVTCPPRPCSQPPHTVVRGALAQAGGAGQGPGLPAPPSFKAERTGGRLRLQAAGGLSSRRAVGGLAWEGPPSRFAPNPHAQLLSVGCFCFCCIPCFLCLRWSRQPGLWWRAVIMLPPPPCPQITQANGQRLPPLLGREAEGGPGPGDRGKAVRAAWGGPVAGPAGAWGPESTQWRRKERGSEGATQITRKLFGQTARRPLPMLGPGT